MTKIVLIPHTIFAKKYAIKYDLYNFRKKGIKTEIWDLFSIIDKKNDKFFKNKIEENSKISFYRKVSSVEDLLVRLRSLNKEKDFIIIGDAITYKNLFIYKIINELKIRTILPILGSIPYKKKNFYKRVNHFINENNLSSIITKIKSKLLLKMKLFFSSYPYFDYIIVSGSSSKKIMKKKYKNSKIIQFHSTDYINYKKKIKSFNNKKIIGNKYAVFLDENMPSAFDTKFLNLKSINENIYYKEINSFLDVIEKKYKLKVIIAMHPKRDFSKNNYYNGRIQVRDNTLGIIRKSKIVILHSSTAVNYAVLTKKPLIFITSNNFLKNIDYQIKVMSGEFNFKPSNMSHFDKPLITKINYNKKIYDKYTNNYIKEKTSNKKSLYFYEKVLEIKKI